MGEHDDRCQVVALQQLGVLADITIKPGVKVGEIEVTCKPPVILEGEIELPDLHDCSDGDSCTVRVYQELCIHLPIIYSAKARAEVRGVNCGSVSWLPAACDFSDDDTGGSSGTHSESTGSWEDESDLDENEE